jgi:hypothetical protein
MEFEIVDEIVSIETFAVNNSIRELGRLQKYYGKGRWRKRKGNCSCPSGGWARGSGRTSLV